MESMSPSELRWLRAYTFVSTALLAVMSLAAFRRAERKEHIDVLDVERINVVEKDGRLRLVVSNKQRSPAVVSRGRTYGEPQRGAGFIFYNDEGSEAGGLIYGGTRENGGPNAGALLTLDQMDQDQVVALEYVDEQGKQRQGLTVLERPRVALGDVLDRQAAIRHMPEGKARADAQQAWIDLQDGVPFGAQRVFVGRDDSRNALVALSDRFGRPRLRLVVDPEGSARVEFLDANARVVESLPHASLPGKDELNQR